MCSSRCPSTRWPPSPGAGWTAGLSIPIVNGVAAGVGSASEDLRPVESGYVRTYALALVVGVLLVVGLAVAQR